MKRTIKRTVQQQLSRYGLLQYLDYIRCMPKTMHWIRNGCTGLAPPPVKRDVVSAYLKRFNLHTFIETGTLYGDTLAHIAHDKRVGCVSIELSDHYYEAARQRFSSYANAMLIHGDSGDILPIYVCDLQEPALFWLDGHYSGGKTARGKFDTPVSSELQAILDSPIKAHVILIDDARCFDGLNSYPHLDSLLAEVRDNGNYDIEISADIIRLTPKK